MSKQINLNADMGESYGAFRVGNDDALLEVIGSASVACGFHAGDPNTMLNIVRQARAAGVSIGAHPGFNDIWGFGRRRIDMDAHDLEYMIAYQIGALQGIATYADMKVTHLKPHGALNNMAATQADYALAIGRAIKSVDPTIIYVALASSEMEKAAEKLGLPLAREAFCDRLYDDDGNLTSRKIPGAVIHDPDIVGRRVVDMVLNNEIVSRTGKRIPQRIDTLCVHGDEPTAVTVARAAKAALLGAGIELVPLTAMKLT